MKHCYILLTMMGILFSSRIQAQVFPGWATPPTYNGTGNGADAPTSMAVDGDGNVIVGGSVLGSAFPDQDWFIIKYDNGGNEIWHKTLPNEGDDFLLDLKIDAVGNIYATGRYNYPKSGPGRQANIYTIKLTSTGSLAWSSYYSFSQGGGFDEGFAIAVDTKGDVYVAGESEVSTGITDVVIIKYDGNLSGEDLTTYKWVKNTDGGDAGSDVGKFLGLTSDGNLYVGGYSSTGGHSFDFFTARYSGATGDLRWIRKFDGAIQLIDSITGIVVDHANNVIVTGNVRNQSQDMQTIKYDTSGNVLASAKYNFVGNDIPFGVTVDYSNNAYVLGISNRGGGAKEDITVIKYKYSINDTSKLWQCILPNPGNDLAVKILLGPDSAIYICGTVTPDSVKYFYAAKINATTGVAEWNVKQGAGGFDAFATAFAIDNNGSIYITGKGKTETHDYDFLTQKWTQYRSISGQVIDDLDGDTITHGNQKPLSHWKVTMLTTTGTFVDSTRTSTEGYYTFNKLGPSVSYDLVCDSLFPYTYLCSPGFGGVAQAVMGTRKIRVTLDSSQGKGISLANNFFNLRDARFSTVTQESLAYSKEYKYKSGPKSKPLKATPTWGNVRDTTWARTDLRFDTPILKAYGGLILGIQQEPSNTTYNYVVLEKKYKPIKNSDSSYSKEVKPSKVISFLPDKKSLFSVPPVYMDEIAKAKCFNMSPVKSGGAIKNLKYNKKYNKIPYRNHLAGEQVALRFNIMSSDIGTTPEGFGDLVYFDSTNEESPYNEYTISEIADLVDSALTYCDGGYQYDSLDTLVRKINHAFTGNVDTLTTSPLKLFGNVRLRDVKYLYKVIVIKKRKHYQQEHNTFVPLNYSLDQNYPNPFNPVTRIRFTLPAEAIAELKIYNILGQEVKTLFHNELFDAGTFEVPFDGTPFASGIYFYRISFTSPADGSHHALDRKMMLLK